MIRPVVLALFALFVISMVGCSKTTKFEVKNDSTQTLENVKVSKNGSPKNLGALEPGEMQVVKFRAIFENRYRLTYGQGGKRFWKDLCYQGWGGKADGTVSIRDEGVLVRCR